MGKSVDLIFKSLIESGYLYQPIRPNNKFFIKNLLNNFFIKDIHISLQTKIHK